MIPYLLHVALLLIICLLFYKLLLQRETFFRLNRFILLSCVLLACSLPLLRVPQQLAFRQVDIPALVARIAPAISLTAPAATSPALPAGGQGVMENLLPLFLRGGTVVLWIYWLGVGVFGLNFLLQLATLLYRSYSHPAIQDGPFRIVEVPGEQAPCSFWHTIFINPATYDWDTYTQILEHEKVHARQYHSLDLLLVELIRVFQWFNPGAWLYRHEVEGNLEFLTDEWVLREAGLAKSQYQRSLFTVSTSHFPISLTSGYNQSLLKRRLLMMNRKQSSVSASWKYLLLAPVLLLSICLLNQPVSYGQAVLRPQGSPTAVNSATLYQELRKDGVIAADTKRITMSWVEGEFTVNGQVQSPALARKYRPLLGLPDLPGQVLFKTVTMD